MPDGSPKVDPVWVDLDGDTIVVTTDAASIKAHNIARDPRVALSIAAHDNPYEQLLIRGRVVDTRADTDLRVLDAMSHKYLGTPFPRRRWNDRVTFRVHAAIIRHYTSSLHDPRTTTPRPS